MVRGVRLDRPHYAAMVFAPGAVLCFNAGLWQLTRRDWKIKLLQSHNNLTKEPLHHIPEEGEEFQRVEVHGHFDNEGSMLVGPRPAPISNASIGGESQKGGFQILTPFIEDETNKIIMVNRGWVPIDAYKSRRHRVQYSGEGFKHVLLRGALRRPEFLKGTFGGTSSENYSHAGPAWTAVRPYEMTLEYYRLRFGSDREKEKLEAHGARKFMVEIMEDFSGDDQVLIKGRAYPIRRETGDLKKNTITPEVHLMYAAFWFTTSFGSLLALRKCFQMHKANVAVAQMERQMAEASAARKIHQAEKAHAEKMAKDAKAE